MEFRKKLASSPDNTMEQAIVAKTAYKEWQKYLVRRKVEFPRQCLKKRDIPGAIEQIAYIIKPLKEIYFGIQ